MTLDVATPYQTYTVAGIGPYAVSWPYVAGAVRVSVRGVDGMPVALASPADWSVSPASSKTAGNVTLAPAAAALHAGKQLILERVTPDQQGWIGNRSSLDRGIETQLDQIVQGQQEMRAGLGRALRATVELPPFTPGPAGSTLIWNGAGFVPGPRADDIEDAEAYALSAQSAAAAAAASVPFAATYGSLDEFRAANVVAPRNQAFVEGRSLVADPGGNITATNSRKWRVAGGDLPLTMCGSDSQLSNDFNGILQQAITDVANGMYDRLVFNPKRDGTPYAETISTVVSIPNGKSLSVHFDRRALIMPQTNFQHIITNGTNGPFVTNLPVSNAALYGIIYAGVITPAGAMTSVLTEGVDFTIGTSGGFYTVTFTPGSADLPVTPVANSILVVSGKEPALEIGGAVNTGQRFTATGHLNIDISRQGYILARATGGGFGTGGTDYVSLDMVLEVTSGPAAGHGAATVAKRGDSGFLPGRSKSTYLRELRAFGMNDLAVYATGNSSTGGADDGKGLHIERIYAERCVNGIKVVRQQRGAYIGRIDIQDGVLAFQSGTTSGLDQLGAIHVGSIRAVRMTGGAISLTDIPALGGKLGAGITFDHVSLEDWGREPDGVTAATGISAGMRFASAAGVTVNAYTATFRDWAPNPAAPAILMNSGASFGNRINSGYIQGAVVGYQETGATTNREGNYLNVTMKDVTTPISVPAASKLLYDLSIVTEVGGNITTRQLRRATVHQTYSPVLYLGSIGSAPSQTVAQGDFLVDADGRCTIAVESQVNNWAFTPTGAELRLALPPGVVPVAGTGAEQFLNALLTSGFVLPAGTFGVIAELANNTTYARFRANVRDPGTGVVSQVILTDAHMQPGQTHALKVSGTFKLTDAQA